MKPYMSRMLLIVCVWMGLTLCAKADDYYFYAPQNSGNAWIGGVGPGLPSSGFLSYPAISSQVYGYGPNVPWDGLVDTSVAKGEYNLGTIPWIGTQDTVYFTVY